VEVLLVLLFAAAALGGGVTALVLGVVAFTRTTRHGAALAAALTKIKELEARLDNGIIGAALAPAAAAAQAAPATTAAPSPTAPPQLAPKPAPAPPAPAPVPARTPMPVVTAPQIDTPPAPAVSPTEPKATEPKTTESITTGPQAAEPQPLAKPEPGAAPPEPALAQPEPQPQPQPEPVAAREEAPAAVAGPAFPRPQPMMLERKRKMAGIEQTLTANWFVWIGAALIALAVVSFVSFAAAQGWYGPRAQIATAFGFSLLALAGSEWVKSRPPTGWLAASQLKRLPAILAALGLFGLFATAWTGTTTWRETAQGPALLPPPAAFALLAASGLAAVVLSLRHGPWFAVLGLIGGYAAPALIPGPQANPALLYGYLTALTVAALSIIHLRKWPGLIWLASAGALVWGVAGAALLPALNDLALPLAGLYALALALVAALFAADDAKQPLQFTAAGRPSVAWSEGLLAAYAVALVSAVLILAIVERSGHAPGALTVMIGFLGVAIALAVWRQSFALVPLIAAAIALAALAVWPRLTAADGGADLVLGPVALFRSAAALGFAMSVGGWLMMARNTIAGPGAALSALGPLGVLIALRDVGGGFGQPAFWAAAAALLALLNAGALVQMLRRVGNADKAPGASAAFTLGTAGAAAMTPIFLLDGIWTPTALAVLLPCFAFVDRRYNLAALKFAAALVAAAAVALLTFPGAVFTYNVGATPVFNALLPAYGVAIASFIVAARLFDRTKGRDDTRIVQGLEVGALVLSAAFLSMEVRHIANNGFLGAPYNSLGEAGGHTLAWLALALGLAVRFGGRPRPLLFWSELAVFAGALLHGVLMAVIVLNPWWGLDPRPAPGAPMFNVLLAAFALPALILGAYAVLRRGQNLPERARLAGGAAMAFAFLWLTLEVRRSFHGAAGMAGPGYLQLEAWAYTAVWIAFALALLGLGLMRKRPALRYASLAVLMGAVVKAFVFDMGALEGGLRALSFLGLGVTIIGVALFYQRVIFPVAGKINAPALDPNPTPTPPPAQSG